MFGKALLLLLNGLDTQRTKYDTQERFRRHQMKQVKGIDLAMLGRDEVVAQYMNRAKEAYGFSVKVWDFDQYAGETTGACFWLSLAAGLAEISTDVLPKVLPGDNPALTELENLRVCGIASATKAGTRQSSLGLCAEALRRYFCNGPKAVLLRPYILEKLYPAFASLRNNGPVRTKAMYNQWVERLNTKEYADELVVLAVALELPVRLVVIPYTPQSSDQSWVITSYGTSSIGLDETRTIYFGNNDIHYVYLSRVTD